MCWVEDRLIIWWNWVWWSDILAADDSVNENACSRELEYEDAEPFEAINAPQSAEKLYVEIFTLISDCMSKFSSIDLYNYLLTYS